MRILQDANQMGKFDETGPSRALILLFCKILGLKHDAFLRRQTSFGLKLKRGTPEMDYETLLHNV